MTLAEIMVASAIGGMILTGVATTYIMSLRGFAAMANYNQIHGDGRTAVNYFAKDMRAVTNIISFPNPSNIIVAIPIGFSSSGSSFGAVTDTASVTYSTSAGALYRSDSRTGNTDMLATNINLLKFTLYDLTGRTNAALSAVKGIQVDIHLRKTIGSQAQTEDYLSARYDMRNTAN
jgi:Tfp pilus assembly protein PilW